MTESIDPDLLLRAYAIGVFPMADSRDAREIFWVEPKKRAILPLDAFHASRSLRQTIRSGEFSVTRDRAFSDVLERCGSRRETWINAQIEAGYNRLHEAGHAHSIECWHKDELVGGLYGVRLGAAFFGESMFSVRRDASKVALAWLVARMRIGSFQLLDCQFMTEHLRSLGAIEMAQSDYMSLLSSALGSGAAGSGAGAAGAGAGAAAGAGVAGAEFGALDLLLEADGAAGDAAASGCVILQLLGHTSQTGCSTTLSDGDSL